MNRTNSTAHPEAIVPHIGTAVTGDKFFPRQALAEAFDSLMTRSNGAKLFGLRRIGKSSEAAACCERLKKDFKIVISEDAQGMTSEVVLLQAILQQLPADGLQKRLLAAINGDNAIAQNARNWLTKASGGKPDDALAYFGPLMAAVENALEQSDGVVLVIDEFPWLCRSILQSDPATGKTRVDVLLAKLRRWRDKGVRMLLMGSIGMVALGRQYGLDLDHLNDLQALSVPPLEPDEALAFVSALAVGGNITGWTPGHTDALLAESAAYYPAMLQKAFEQTSLGGRAAPIERFADFFAEKIRPDFDATYYQQFDKRRKRYRELPDPLPHLLEGVLQAVMKVDGSVGWDALSSALATSGEVSDADLGDALSILQEDGFLAMRAERDGSLWRPASGLMSAWWRQRRGVGRR